MAKLTYNNREKRFEWLGGYKSRFQPRSSGFQWNAAAKVWWTDNKERAYLLRRFADSLAKAELGTFTGETMSLERRRLVLVCIKRLAMVCDFAVLLDGQGFSKSDASIGHQLASKDVLTTEQAELGLKLVRWHQHQLPRELLLTVGAIRGSD